MKLIKTLTAFALCLATVFAVSACGSSSKNASAYGIVYSSYVGKAMVTMKDGKITDVVIDEVMLPDSWACIAEIETEILADDTVRNTEYTGTATEKLDFAKKIIIDGTIFTARNNGADNTAVDYFNASKNGNTSLREWLKTDANAEWYFNAIVEGKYDVLKSDDSAYDVAYLNSGELTKSERWVKSKNGYWSTGFGIGWQPNMDAISSYIIEYGFTDYLAERDNLTRDNREYVINEVRTGATVTDFVGYMNLAHAAYTKIA